MNEPMSGGSEFRHACSFCGWARASATPVMLSPSCERCGCRLDACGAEAATVVDDEMPWTRPWVVTLLRRLAVLLGALALYAAASLGHHLGGAAGATIAFGLGGFLMLPFVPERLKD